MSIGNREICALHEEIRACRICRQQGYPIEGAPLVWGGAPAEFLLIGQALGLTDLRTGRMYSGPAARKLFGWLKEAGFQDEDFGTRIVFTALTRCFPGRVAGRSVDRAPSAAEVANCRQWLEKEIALVGPRVLILFGKMAADASLGKGESLAQRIGRRYERDGRVCIPLPHASGASTWLNQAANKELLRQAIGLIRKERNYQERT